MQVGGRVGRTTADCLRRKQSDGVARVVYLVSHVDNKAGACPRGGRERNWVSINFAGIDPSCGFRMGCPRSRVRYLG